jgi:hypothetical protein
MDPNLFHLDWERTTEILAAIVVLSMFVERALAIVFEHRWYIHYVDKDGKRPSGAKELISLAVCIALVLYWQFDAISGVILTDHVTVPGMLLTAGIIAGGSKGSVKLFREILNWKSSAYKDAYEKPKAPAPEPAGV